MKYIGVFFIILAFIVEPAQAYIDPGSGSTIMSIIIGLVVSIGLAVKTYWYKLVALFTGKKNQKKS